MNLTFTHSQNERERYKAFDDHLVTCSCARVMLLVVGDHYSYISDCSLVIYLRLVVKSPGNITASGK